MPKSISDNHSTGFYADAFYKDNDVFIVVRGTQATPLPPDFQDLKNDFQMMCKKIPDQLKDREVIGTGVSLGGSLLQLFAVKEDKIKVITFNAYGAQPLINQLSEKYGMKFSNKSDEYNDRIINIIRANDYTPVTRELI